MKPFSYDGLRVRLEHYQQAYAAMERDHTDQAGIDRVFNMTPSDKPLPRGSVPRRSSWRRRRFATATRPRLASRRRRQPACPVSRG
jgi:response regulator of citrate/malate metabolism